ncbi:hypothetical protein [Paenibacillus chungangensis]|uniref:Uncharacterized protein n=1 Tax=Paenibacillus chungangensis TaxID=696535 RepID=A0ABW3HSI2_9BACL
MSGANVEADALNRLVLDFDEAVQMTDVSGLTGKVDGISVPITSGNE